MSKNNKFEINSELTKVKVMASHFHDFCSMNKVDKEIAGLLELALVEAVNNIIIHSYEGKSGFTIDADYELSNSQIIIKLTDSGKEFKTLDTDTKNDEDEIAEGNWGLDLINSISDEVTRVRENNKNTLIIKKDYTS